MQKHVKNVARRKEASVMSTAEYFAKRQKFGPPWFLICKEAARGVPLESISKRYGIKIETIQQRLQLAISHNDDESTVDGGVRNESGSTLKVRNAVEINRISENIKTDLSSALQTLVRDFTREDLSMEDIDNLKSLIDAGCKLFGWNVQKQAPAPVTLPSHAVNLALIQTTPEQLKAMGQHPVDQQGAVPSSPE